MNIEKKITDIAIAYAKANESQYFSFQFLFTRPSQFLDGYWDASFKVFNEDGNEIDGPLLVAINELTGKISTMEEVISSNMNNNNINISNDPIIK